MHHSCLIQGSESLERRQPILGPRHFDTCWVCAFVLRRLSTSLILLGRTLNLVIALLQSLRTLYFKAIDRHVMESSSFLLLCPTTPTFSDTPSNTHPRYLHHQNLHPSSYQYKYTPTEAPITVFSAMDPPNKKLKLTTSVREWGWMIRLVCILL